MQQRRVVTKEDGGVMFTTNANGHTQRLEVSDNSRLDSPRAPASRGDSEDLGAVEMARRRTVAQQKSNRSKKLDRAQA